MSHKVLAFSLGRDRSLGLQHLMLHLSLLGFEQPWGSWVCVDEKWVGWISYLIKGKGKRKRYNVISCYLLSIDCVLHFVVQVKYWLLLFNSDIAQRATLVAKMSIPNSFGQRGWFSLRYKWLYLSPCPLLFFNLVPISRSRITIWEHFCPPLSNFSKKGRCFSNS